MPIQALFRSFQGDDILYYSDANFGAATGSNASILTGSFASVFANGTGSSSVANRSAAPVNFPGFNQFDDVTLVGPGIRDLPGGRNDNQGNNIINNNNNANGNNNSGNNGNSNSNSNNNNNQRDGQEEGNTVSGVQAQRSGQSGSSQAGSAAAEAAAEPLVYRAAGSSSRGFDGNSAAAASGDSINGGINGAVDPSSPTYYTDTLMQAVQDAGA